jgi:antitoxin HigA-1
MTESLNRDDQAADWSDVSSGEAIGPVTPGDVLRHEFMEPLGITARALARDLDVPANHVTRVLRGETRITARTAIMLSRRFGTSPDFWMNLQTAHDLEATRAEMVPAAWSEGIVYSMDPDAAEGPSSLMAS